MNDEVTQQDVPPPGETPEDEDQDSRRDPQPAEAGADGDGQDAAPDEAAETVDELAAARQEAERFQDRYLRAVAELDNFRKRTVRLRAETRDETLRDVLLQIAPLFDNLRRALELETDDAGAVRHGIDMIVTQFKSALSGFGLEEIEAVGQPFDPNEHEAMMQVPTSEHPPGIVIQEMERGFRLRDKIVRPARVVVSAASEESTTANEETEEGQA